MSKSTEQSVKHKLKNISRELKTPFNHLLDTLFLERFLVRVGKSRYSDRLIFKGGMCLAQFIKLGRETRDIDFLLIESKGSVQVISDIFKEVASLDVNDDFVFSQTEVRELSIEHKKYPGYRILVQGQLGQIKNKVVIDIGIGDVVRPRSLEVELMKAKSPVFEEMISLNSYPPEYIFSEKVEAILHLGEANSRMKDFYDCYRLATEGILDEKLLKKAIVETMENRGTKLEPISRDIQAFETRWRGFLRKNNINALELEDVVSTINELLKRV